MLISNSIRWSLRNALAFLLCVIVQSPAYSAETAWKLRLDHVGFGRCKAIFSETKICFDDGITRRLILPPYDSSIVYSTDTKKWLKSSNDTFANSGAPNYSCAIIKPIGKETILGFNCTHYKIKFPNRRQTGDFWSTKEIPMRPKLAELLCQMCASPTGLGVPVKMILNSAAGRPEKIFEVLKLEKTIVNEADFVPPKGYTVARDLFDLEFCGQGKSYEDAVDSTLSSQKRNLK